MVSKLLQEVCRFTWDLYSFIHSSRKYEIPVNFIFFIVIVIFNYKYNAFFL